MASNGSIIEDGVRFVKEARLRLVEIASDNAKQLLHEEEHAEGCSSNDKHNQSQRIIIAIM
jgi:hypothetical protein